MKIEITETIGQITEIENKVNEIVISPFDVAADAIMKSTLQAKGDMVSATGSGAYSRVPAASGDGKVLMSDSAQSNGVTWGNAGGDVTVTLINRASTDVAAGDVLVIENAYAEAFNTTTTPNDLRVLGVAGEAIFAASAGKVQCIAGTLVTVNCDTGAVNRGEWLVTSATAKRAKSGGYFQTPGAFAIAMNSKTAGSIGTVKAILAQGFMYGIRGTTAWAAGGKNASNYLTDTQKFIMASASWATISGAALPAGTQEPLGIGYQNISGQCIGGSDGGGVKVTAYKLSFATETFAANAGCNLAAAARLLNSGLNSANKGFRAGGYTSVWGGLTDKFDFATDIRSALTAMTTADTYRLFYSDGAYGYILKATGFRITVATDVVAAHTGVNKALTLQGANISFPSIAGYGTDGTSCLKVTFATGNQSTLGSSPASAHGSGQGVTDGATYGWIAGADGTPYSAADKFTLSTETWSADSGAAQNPGKYSAAYFNNGAL